MSAIAKTISDETSKILDKALKRVYMPAIPKIDPSLFRDHTLAGAFVERLKGWIKKVESNLKSDESLAIRVILLNGKELRVKNIGYHNPNLIAFHCIDNSDKEHTVLTHQNSVQLVYTVEKPVKMQEKTPIGFIHP